MGQSGQYLLIVGFGCYRFSTWSPVIGKYLAWFWEQLLTIDLNCSDGYSPQSVTDRNTFSSFLKFQYYPWHFQNYSLGRNLLQHGTTQQWLVLDESPTSANLGNDHRYEPFWEAESKAMRAYAQNGQYHTIMESRVHLTTRTFELSLRKRHFEKLTFCSIFGWILVRYKF